MSSDFSDTSDFCDGSSDLEGFLRRLFGRNCSSPPKPDQSSEDISSRSLNSGFSVSVVLSGCLVSNCGFRLTTEIYHYH